MENNTPPSKLDETLKESLSSYDAKYDSGDWSRMERMLDSTPKSIAPKGSYNMALIIGGIVLAGGFVIYKGVTSSYTPTPDTTTETETVVTPPENKTNAVIKPTPAPSVVVKTEPAVVKETPVNVPELKTPLPEVKPSVGVTENKQTDALTQKKKSEKKATTPGDSDKVQKVSVMGNEPVFGDMIDSSKGIIHKTKEKESTKKAAVEKGSKSSVGLNSLFNLNADSLRKQKEMMQKDSIKR